jgi:hypothetical protein
MRQCVEQGELRAWFDRELPAERAAAVEQHLAECAGCAAAYQAVAARAARVTGWMESLSADVPMPAAAPRKPAARPAVWVAVGALAAGLVLAVMFARQPGKAPIKVPVEAVAVPPAAVQEQPVAATAMSVSAPAARVRRRAARAAHPTPVQYYMALDEEPIDTGLVMRVALASGMQADVIVDGDGRARAIRPISVMKEEQ